MRKLTQPEYDAIIAGLRAIQNLMMGHKVTREDFDTILTNDDTQVPLNEDGIDKLVDDLQDGTIHLPMAGGRS